MQRLSEPALAGCQLRNRHSSVSQSRSGWTTLPGRVRRCRRITRSSFVDRVDLRPLKRYVGDQAFLTEYEGKDGFLQSLAVIRATSACFNQSDSRVGSD